MSLQKKCIKVIVREFERFYLAYQISDDENLKRNLEFLRRVYSDRIAEKLFKKDEWKASEYIDFLLNKYLKMLHTSWLSGCSWETIVAKFAEIGSNLECIYEFQDRKPWKDIFCYLPNLKIATFDQTYNDEILKTIATFCPNIVEINAKFSSEVTDRGIKYLCMKENGKLCCPKLKIINIHGSGVTKAGVVHLIKNLPSLEVAAYFDLSEVLYSLHKKDLSRLDKLEPYNITRLNLYCRDEKPFYTDMLKICFSVCPRLKYLFGCVLKEDHLELFDTLHELEKLEVGCYPRDFDINNFLKLKGAKLTSLSIKNCSLSLSNVVKSCPCLTDLRFVEVNFQNSSDISPVFKRPKTSVSAPLVSASAPSSSVLEEILFQFCNISSNEFKAEFLNCFKHSPIKKIHISHSQVEMKFLKDILLNCYSLTSFWLINCNIGDEIYELFKFAKELPNKPEILFIPNN